VIRQVAEMKNEEGLPFDFATTLSCVYFSYSTGPNLLPAR
jgi:hypothetical protein